MAYLRDGVWHIWIGFDHILFLLALLLPAVGVWAAHRWQPVTGFAPAFWDVLRIVTSFTVAHSITLSLATLGFVSLPSRLVESAIAASVVLAALNNVWPMFLGQRWLVAFALRARARLRFCQRAGRPGASAGHAGAGAGGLQRRRRSWVSWPSCWFSCRWPMRCGAAGSTGAA